MLRKSRTTGKIQFKKKNPNIHIPVIKLELNYSISTSKSGKRVTNSKKAGLSGLQTRDFSLLNTSIKTPMKQRNSKKPGEYWYQKDSDHTNEMHYYGLLDRFKKKRPRTNKNSVKKKISLAINRANNRAVLSGYNLRSRGAIKIDRPKTAIIKGLNTRRFFDSSSALTNKIEKKLQKEYCDNNYEFYQPDTDNIRLDSKYHKFFLKDFKQLKKKQENKKQSDMKENEINIKRKFKISNRRMYSLEAGERDDPMKRLKNNVFRYKTWQEGNQLKQKYKVRARSSNFERAKKKTAQGVNTSGFLLDTPKIHLNSKVIKNIEKRVKSRKKKKGKKEKGVKSDLDMKILRQKELKLRMLKQGNRLRKRTFMDNYIKNRQYTKEKSKSYGLSKKKYLDPQQVEKKRRNKMRDLKRKKEIARMGLVEQERIMSKRLPRNFYRR